MAGIFNSSQRRRTTGGASDTVHTAGNDQDANQSGAMADIPVGGVLRAPENLHHIAFIMDGNGRWATGRGMPREFGHKRGAEVFERIVEYCGDIFIPCVTVYAFSTENWSRPKNEVDTIMELFGKYLRRALDTMEEKRIHYTFIGDRTVFPEATRERMEQIERISARFSRRLNIAINYGGRDEILRAVNRFVANNPGVPLTAGDIEANLDTVDSPPPDLIVRTAGEQRMSNFLTWQAAYAEYYFTDTLWPDMTPAEVDRAVAAFASRGRRYGGVKNK